MITGALCLNNQMRFQGNARYAVWGIMSGAIINILLDPLFIFVMDMGVAGAAWATVTGQTISLLVLLRLCYCHDNIPIRWRSFSASRYYVKELIAGGTPSISRMGMGCVATMMLNIAAATYGDAAIAGMSIVSRITMFIFSAVVGLGQGFQPFCGYAYGAQTFDRLRRGFWFCVWVATSFLVVVAIVGISFSHSIIGMFRDDADVVAVGSVALALQLATYPLNAFIMMSNMLTQTIRKPWRANLLASARHGLFFIPLIVLMPQWFGLFGIEACQSVSDILTFILAVGIMYKVLSFKF
jgi:Na+-driven multidrug efflux pump